MPPSRKAAGATQSSIRTGPFWSAVWRRRPISRCRSWLGNLLGWACGSIKPRSRAGTSEMAIAIKKSLLASEQDRPDVAAARRESVTKRQPRMRLEAHRLVFVGETGTTTKMVRTRGRCAKSQRLKGQAPFGHWKTQTFIAGLRRGALTAPFVVDQPMNRRIFDTWVRTQLVPTLSKGDVVILDNLAAHKSAAAEQVIRERGAWLLFLPPYSPDLNPFVLTGGETSDYLAVPALLDMPVAKPQAMLADKGYDGDDVRAS